MTDASGQQISLDADILEADSEAFQTGISSTSEEAGQAADTGVLETDTERGDAVPEASAVKEESEADVEYIAQEVPVVEAESVAEEEQTMTTSLQFDPANPSVLYTADGTAINQADLTPEERALVQAALQQHLAEQEAEQQLQMLQEDEAVQDPQQSMEQEATSEPQVMMLSQPLSGLDPGDGHAAEAHGASNLAKGDTSASQIVQTLADNVRKQLEMEEKMKMSFPQLHVAKVDTSEIQYSEKIVIRQGQPELVKEPVKGKPELPAALADLMPKVEIGKDGSQVIRIHQSQITSSQLRALQENPNVRLVFRSANSMKPRPMATPTSAPKKRGRPRKVPGEVLRQKEVEEESEPENEEPPAKTRSGRITKRSVFMKDYYTPKVSKDMDDDYDVPERKSRPYFTPISTTPLGDKRPRGRPPGKSRGYYTKKVKSLETKNALLPMQMKLALTPIELALSARRKNRLREMLSACSEDEIMEVAMPHFARVFSLWDFLVTKVEKNKMSRVFFADIYSEYEFLHKYVTKLAERYNQTIGEKATPEVGDTPSQEATTEEADAGSKESTDKLVEKALTEVKFTKLAESLGLKGSTLQEAEVSLLNADELQGITRKRVERKRPEGNIRRQQNAAEVSVPDGKSKKASDGAAPTAGPTTQATPSLKPLGLSQNLASAEESSKRQEADAPTETDVAAATASAETTDSSGSQLIQIGQGEERQYIEVPEGYTLIQTPEGLVMSQPGTTVSQGDDGAIYITHEDGTTTPLNATAQEGVPMETVETLLSLDGQQH